MLKETDEFKTWIRALRDRGAVGVICFRLRALDSGNPGDVKSVGEGISELRIDRGPGYRVYYRAFDDGTVILLGGDKDDQHSNIAEAKSLAKKYADGNLKAT